MTYQDDSPTHSNEILDNASRGPKILFDASTSRVDDSTREPGLILTKDQIKNIKRYEMVGLKLPTELKDVITYLGYEKGAGRGLEAVDFKQTFTTVRDHAATWNPLRNELQTIGSRLNVTAGKMLIFGDGVEEVYEEIKSGSLKKYNIKTLEELKKVELEFSDSLSVLELDAEDKETVKEFGYCLDRISALVNERRAEADQLKVQLDKFSYELINTVYKAVQFRLSAINNNTLEAEVKALKLLIEQRAQDIDDKTKEYNDLVKKALGSATTLNIAGVAMSIYLGVKAENIRKDRNKMRADQARDVAVMNTKHAILGRLNTVRMDLQDLDMIIIDADIATKNLVAVWNNIGLYIEASSNAVDAITDELKLFRFMIEFRMVITPWNDIKDDTRELLEVFKQADDEFRIEYEQQGA